MEDGRKFPLRHEPAWCFDCDFLTSAEKLLTEREQLGQMVRMTLGTLSDSQIEAIVSDPTKLERVLRARSSQDNFQISIREWDVLELEMIRTRRSLARCLTCGGTKLLRTFSPPTSKTIDFDIGDGRWVKLGWSGIAEDSVARQPMYSLEGLRISRPGE
ncbi:hypothetical protein C5Y96_07725 [Blastopirellula marina]|uniref:Uncharacterized protein n=2 Tax=Pirellulales TaxID=2691354 RepID=A0A2S8FXY9_9BACT|nr:hypothetical protein C5Y96_07725 [Blastopirellula marina]RCS53753.1 hypothetical protein DTL36_07735 [Bremerella cremea]